MIVVKNQFKGVVANGFYLRDVDVFFSNLQYFLPRAVALYFGRGRINAQIFGR